MTLKSCDILISGAGIAGLVAAIGFADKGAKVILVDPAPPVTDRGHADADHRSTAFLQPAQALLEQIGAWRALAPHAMPLQVMRIVDATDDGAVTTAAEFDAAEISDLPFGWNIPNWQIRHGLMERLDALSNITFLPGLAVTSVLTREREARVTLSDGQRLRTDLLIGADGRNSPVRQALAIPVTPTRFGQKALAFAVTHPVPHDNVSTEIHRTGGPFTLVPLPDRDGTPSSAVVWMERGPEALRLSQLDTTAFEAEMTERSAHLFGPLTLASPRALWPVIAQLAERFTSQRTALIAEAAHVVPPIGAQGLNTSLADIESLLSLSDQGLGSRAMLDTYNAARFGEARTRVLGVSALNRASMAGSPPARALRSEMLGLLHGIAPLRRSLMKKGLGV